MTGVLSFSSRCSKPASIAYLRASVMTRVSEVGSKERSTGAEVTAFRSFSKSLSFS